MVGTDRTVPGPDTDSQVDVCAAASDTPMVALTEKSVLSNSDYPQGVVKSMDSL